MKIACVLLASGTAERFGTNKLLADFLGRPLAERAFGAIPGECFTRVAIVTAYAELADMAERFGFEPVRNTRPEAGVSRTVRLGLSAAGDADACMFCVCDQPYLAKGSVERMARDYAGGIAALSFGGRRGNPVIFPRELFSELNGLCADQGGSAVLSRHKDQLRLYPAECALELCDADTQEAFERLEQAKNLFLTGERGVGKTTLLARAVAASGVPVTGFLTRPYEINGRPAGHAFHALSGGLAAEPNDQPISVRIGGTCKPAEHTFEGLGRSSVEAAMQDGAPLVLMDELGVLERNAQSFQRAVHACLDGKKPVLGVLKDADADWLATIRGRTDTRVLRLLAGNRDEIAREVAQFLQNRVEIKDET